MEGGGRIILQRIEGVGEGWMLREDLDLEGWRPARMVRVLHLADPLARGHASEVKERFAGREMLQYILIDGRMLGVVCGHWRIGPHDVEDIAVELPEDELEDRREEILAQVVRVYSPPFSRILRFAGREL